jgi:hypothetical protein
VLVHEGIHEIQRWSDMCTSQCRHLIKRQGTAATLAPLDPARDRDPVLAGDPAVPRQHDVRPVDDAQVGDLEQAGAAVARLQVIGISDRRLNER